MFNWTQHDDVFNKFENLNKCALTPRLGRHMPSFHELCRLCCHCGTCNNWWQSPWWESMSLFSMWIKAHLWKFSNVPDTFFILRCLAPDFVVSSGTSLSHHSPMYHLGLPCFRFGSFFWVIQTCDLRFLANFLCTHRLSISTVIPRIFCGKRAVFLSLCAVETPAIQNLRVSLFKFEHLTQKRNPVASFFARIHQA